MSFGGTGSLPAQKPKLAALDESKTATIEQGRPVPWFCGTARMGVTWLGQPYALKTEAIVQETKKQDIITGYDYYGGAAAIVCVGVVDRLEAIYFDDEMVWEGPLVRGVDAFEEITIEGRGLMRIYWGTADQAIDTTLEDLEAGTSVPPDPEELHPAYRHQCYIVFPQLLLGEARTQFPNVELVLSRFPQPDWMSTTSNVQGDCNPVAVLWDILTNTFFGMGLSEDRLDTTDLDDVATVLAAECNGISPFLDREEEARTVLLRVTEHINGYLTTGTNGKIRMRLVRPESTSGIPHIHEEHLVEPPSISVESITETDTEAVVRFTNRDQGYKESAASATNLGNRTIAVEPRTTTLDREWITRPYAAGLMAQIAAQMAAIPGLAGTITIRSSALGSLTPGDIFRLSYPHAGICNLISRIKSIMHPSPTDDPVVSIDWILDKGWLGKGFAVISPPTPPEQIIHEPVAAGIVRLLEAPTAYMPIETFDRPVIIPLVQRPSGITTGFYVHQQLPDGSYAEIYQSTAFTQFGTLTTEYPENTWLLDDILGFEIQLTGPDITLANIPFENASSNPLYGIVGNEIMFLFGATLVAAGKYRVYAFRAQVGTIKETHAIGAGMHIINSSRLPYFSVDSALESITVKIQPYIGQGSRIDLSLVDPVTLSITGVWKRPQRPQNITAKGSTATDVSTYNTTDDIVIAWSPGGVVSAANFWALFEGGEVANDFETCLEFRDSLDVLRETLTYAAGITSALIDNADLQDMFLSGGSPSEPASFTLRAYHRRDGFKSQYYASITVTKN